jgi:hypothetical protein
MSAPGVSEATAEEKFLEWSNAGGVAEAEACEITVATFPDGPPEAMGCPPYAAVPPPGAGQPALAVNPTALSFGDVVVGQQASDSVTVTNTGTADATMGTATVTGAELALGPDTCSGATVVATTGACVITVNVAPTASGPLSGTLAIPSGNGGTLTVPLSANGVGAIPGDIALNKTRTNFGQLSPGRTSTQAVIVRNDGQGALTVTGATVTGTGFSLAQNRCPAALLPGGSCSISVRFTAALPGGPRAGQLTVTSNDPDEASVSVQLSGSVKAR